ncbi:vanillyl alcohol oxidase [Aaosphaeria arxii CBS 175.79]|uniref:Vanillyl alcohol oxidase n=1 Tax=Aaosphaeria arxii CBS 175.79 TaxID=1450172 RepID=A0A6A5X765_9PLEO|nr:vanillyl alcohol oxidase [Aaosphaeria arxii CBS 175.79]KAF2008788.1 vanillyl alcohol oxidase [Aaosphaeria arxii CBS 175.79]
MVEFYHDSVLQKHHNHAFTTVPSIEGDDPLPPNVDRDTFNRFLSLLCKIVGEENVITGEELRNFRDPYPLTIEEYQPSAAACPITVEQIQSILKIANEYCIPLWVCSQGKNFGYGGPAPRQSGTLVLSLYRMKRIIEVNEKFSYVLVEPGVTFFELYEHLRAKGIPLWVGVPALGWGSVVGNTMDRGHGYTISGDRQHGIRSLEVILPSGEIMRTGQWGVTGSPSAHTCSNNFGPQVDGLFLQTNLGIVSKLAVAVDPAPQAFMNVRLIGDEVDDLGPIIDCMQQLSLEGILQNHGMITNINHFASHDVPKYKHQREEGPLLPGTIANMKKMYQTGYWRCVFNLYGTSAMVHARYARIKEVFSAKIPGMLLDGDLLEGKDGRPVDALQVGTLSAGVPTMDPVRLADYNLPEDGSGAGGHIDTTLILPADGETVVKWFIAAKKIMEDEGVDPFIGCHVFPNYILFVQEYVFDKRQAIHRERGRKVVESLLVAAKRSGFANYRSHLQHMDTVQDMYNFNNHIYRRFIQQLKTAIDPNGILAPGKQGIWPQQAMQVEIEALHKSYSKTTVASAESK